MALHLILAVLAYSQEIPYSSITGSWPITCRTENPQQSPISLTNYQNGALFEDNPRRLLLDYKEVDTVLHIDNDQQ